MQRRLKLSCHKTSFVTAVHILMDCCLLPSGKVGAGSLIDLQDYVLRATESDANELYTL